MLLQPCAVRLALGAKLVRVLVQVDDVGLQAVRADRSAGIDCRGPSRLSASALCSYHSYAVGEVRPHLWQMNSISMYGSRGGIGRARSTES